MGLPAGSEASGSHHVAEPSRRFQAHHTNHFISHVLPNKKKNKKQDSSSALCHRNPQKYSTLMLPLQIFPDLKLLLEQRWQKSAKTCPVDALTRPKQTVDKSK